VVQISAGRFHLEHHAASHRMIATGLNPTEATVLWEFGFRATVLPEFGYPVMGVLSLAGPVFEAQVLATRMPGRGLAILGRASDCRAGRSLAHPHRPAIRLGVERSFRSLATELAGVVAALASKSGVISHQTDLRKSWTESVRKPPGPVKLVAVAEPKQPGKLPTRVARTEWGRRRWGGSPVAG